MELKAPRGTKDIYGSDVYVWQNMEEILRRVCKNFCIEEIRTPVFEHTEVFQRSVGETTDIVQKEMYTFEDKKGRSITLKPEGTAGVARAYIENKMFADADPVKLYYITPAFRYERPQAGRMRQFHQFGVEFFGSDDPAADAEVISLAYEIIERFGLDDIELRINSLGCPKCREKYNNVLKNYIGLNLENLCADCKERFLKNPLRVLDCKNKNCQSKLEGAPSVLECLDSECRGHFETLKNILDGMGIRYVVDPTIVRGLDYYTKTVFEFVTSVIGAQGTVCGGGRYDNLIEQFGGNRTGAIGFGMGLERMALLIGDKDYRKKVDIYVGAVGENGYNKSQAIVYKLRKNGVNAQGDTVKRSVKAQLKYADKIKAAYCLIIGDDEIEKNTVNIKNMSTGEQKQIKLADILEKEIEQWLN